MENELMKRFMFEGGRGDFEEKFFRRISLMVHFSETPSRLLAKKTSKIFQFSASP
jgi:hypothetical protein